MERIRETRASERRFKTNCIGLLPDTQQQSSLLADHLQTHMGLKTWKNAQKEKSQKGDISVAKNYLEEKEIKDLNGS